MYLCMHCSLVQLLILLLWTDWLICVLYLIWRGFVVVFVVVDKNSCLRTIWLSYNKEVGFDNDEWYVTEISLTQRMLRYAGSVCLTSFPWRSPRKTPRPSSALSCALASSRQARSSNSSVRCRPTPYLRWGIVGKWSTAIASGISPQSPPPIPRPCNKVGQGGGITLRSVCLPHT